MQRVSSSPTARKGLVSSAMKKSKDTTFALADSTAQLVASALSTGLTMVLVIAVSIFLYGTLYYSYMPVETVDETLNLGFEPCEGQTADRCSFPTASLAIGRKQQMLQGQVYSIRMQLKLPDSPRNEDLGMFMACMNITGSGGAIVSRSCRSSLAQYRSPLLRGLETIAFLPALLTGWTEQQLAININFFEAFQPDPHMVAHNIHVELKSHLLQVTRVSLQLEASLSGLRHLMYRHPWVSAVFGVGTNILILLTIIAVSWTRFRMQSSSSTAVESLENEEVEEVEEEEEEEEKDENEDEDDALMEDEGLEGPEDAEVPDAEAAGSVAQQNLSDKFKWLVIKFIFKAFWHVVRVALFVGVAMVCYELTRLGPNAPREALLEAAKEDLKGLAVFIAKHMKDLAAALGRGKQ